MWITLNLPALLGLSFACCPYLTAGEPEAVGDWELYPVTAENRARSCRIPTVSTALALAVSPYNRDNCILFQLSRAQEAAGPWGPILYLCINNWLEDG